MTHRCCSLIFAAASLRDVRACLRARAQRRRRRPRPGPPSAVVVRRHLPPHSPRKATRPSPPPRLRQTAPPARPGGFVRSPPPAKIRFRHPKRRWAPSPRTSRRTSPRCEGRCGAQSDARRRRRLDFACWSRRTSGWRSARTPRRASCCEGASCWHGHEVCAVAGRASAVRETRGVDRRLPPACTCKQGALLGLR